MPYNPYLIRHFKANINIEIYSSVQAIKYIHKYIYKGSDRATIQVDIEKDEFAQYLQERYIGPTEAMWQIFEFSIYEEFPLVKQLAIHLSEEQPVYFEEDVVAKKLQEKMDSARSTLMAFFEYNNTKKESRRYFYQEFLEHYVYLRKERRWKLRQQRFAIERIYHCNPFAGERYYLRLLLTIVRGAKSFQDLCTVNGVLHSTFQATCVARGLLEDD